MKAEIDRLKESLEQMHARSDKRDDEIDREARAEGMEKAAKMVENVRPWPGQITLAASIRAEIKREAGSRELLAPANEAETSGSASRTSTGDSDA